MTKTIDDKLREILETYGDDPKSYSTPIQRAAQEVNYLNDDQAIAQIKQAFEDEGWFKPKATDGVRYYSGQYWYDRFEEELKKVWEAVEMENGMFFALQAAKKASGLEK